MQVAALQRKAAELLEGTEGLRLQLATLQADKAQLAEALSDRTAERDQLGHEANELRDANSTLQANGVELRAQVEQLATQREGLEDRVAALERQLAAAQSGFAGELAAVAAQHVEGMAALKAQQAAELQVGWWTTLHDQQACSSCVRVCDVFMVI